MDLETENRLAALLMEEARRLRAQADNEGVHAYLRKNNIRGRPNSRFLTATVLGVEQANRAVEVREMWSARNKELELESRLSNKSRGNNGSRDEKSDRSLPSRSRHEHKMSNSASSNKRGYKDHYSDDEGGLRDEEIEEFLRSRVKRGRGAIGSRMDEPGPYLPSTTTDQDSQLSPSADIRVKEEWERRIVGPEKPTFLKSDEPCEERYNGTSSPRKHRSKLKSKKDESRKEKRKEKRSKHRRRE